MAADPDGVRAVALARQALVRRLVRGDRSEPGAAAETEALPPVFAERRGAFVTLKAWPSGELRGCIGFPLPIHPLRAAVTRAAVAAALEDPRFAPVRADELDRLTVEVSILTRPEPLAGRGREARRAGVQVGRDGLIVEAHGASGLLLPQVATEYAWDAETFLRETCRKAGLPARAWEDDRVSVLRFEARVYAEERPGGPVGPAGGLTRRTPDGVA